MRLGSLVAIALMLGFGGPALAASNPVSGESTLTRFNFAYHLQQSGDQARDKGDLQTALTLYNEAVKEYATLRQEFPDWDPAITEFRANYCRDEIHSLQRRLAAEANAKTLPPSTSAPIPPPGPTDQSPAPTNGTAAAASPPPAPAQAAAQPSTAAKLDALKREAAELMRQNQAAAARDLLMEALHLNPDDTGARLMIGAVQCQLGNYEDALYVLEPLVEEQPQSAPARLALGTAYLGLGDPVLAASNVTQAVTLDDTSAEGHYNLARVLLLLSPTNAPEAAAHYQRALALGAMPDADLERLLAPAATNAAPSHAAPGTTTPPGTNAPPAP